MRFPIPFTLLVFVVAGIMAADAHAQVFTIGTGTTINTNTTYPAPYGNWYWGSRHQFLITAAEMTAAGMSAGAITAIAFDVTTVNGQALQNFTIKLGQTMATDMTAWQPAPNLVFGPLATYTVSAGWNTHAFCGSEFWNGTSNLVIETCHQNSSFTNNCIFNQSATAFVSSRWYRADAQGVCANTGQTGTMSQRPNIRLTQSLPPPVEYQVNQAGCSLLLNGTVGSACFPTVVNQSAYLCAAPAPVTGNLVLSTTQVGFPWDIVLSAGNLAAASGGGLVLPDAQIVNINLAAPLYFLNNFLATNFPGIGIPGISTASMAIAYSIATTTDVTLQAITIDAGSATGVRLSQATEFHVAVLNAAPSVPGPTTGTPVTVNVTAAPTCWVPVGVPFYGTTYATIYVSPEGRITFGSTSTDTTPLVADALTGPPFIGFWTDLDPVAGGASVTITNPGPGLIQVSYNNCRYQGEAAGGNTFQILIDANTGAFSLSGLTGIAPNPHATPATTDAQFLGISRGNTGSSNGAITTFTAGGAGIAPNGTVMVYDFYTQFAGGPGLVNSLIGGTLGSVTFQPSGSAAPNYDWYGL